MQINKTFLSQGEAIRNAHAVYSGKSLTGVSIAKTSGQHDAFATATRDKNETNEFLVDLREILRKGWSDAAANQTDRCGELIDKDGDFEEL